VQFVLSVGHAKFEGGCLSVHLPGSQRHGGETGLKETQNNNMTQLMRTFPLCTANFRTREFPLWMAFVWGKHAPNPIKQKSTKQVINCMHTKIFIWQQKCWCLTSVISDPDFQVRFWFLHLNNENNNFTNAPHLDCWDNVAFRDRAMPACCTVSRPCPWWEACGLPCTPEPRARCCTRPYSARNQDAAAWNTGATGKPTNFHDKRIGVNT